jgi:hypothetical protein
LILEVEMKLDLRDVAPEPDKVVFVEIEGVGKMGFEPPQIESIHDLALQTSLMVGDSDFVFHSGGGPAFEFVSWDDRKRVVVVRAIKNVAHKVD